MTVIDPHMRNLAGPPDTARSFAVPVRVYFQDTDAGGVVYHARYLDFFERCRMEWLRSLDIVSTTLVADTGVLFVVRSLDIEYLKPARLDDALDVDLRLEAPGGVQLMLRQSVRRGDETLVTARVQLAAVSAAGMKPSRLPPELRARLAAWLPSEPDRERP